MPIKTLVAAHKRLNRKREARRSLLAVLGPQWIYENDLRRAAGVGGGLFRKIMAELEKQGVAVCRWEPAPLYLFNLWRPEGDAKREWMPRRRWRLAKGQR